MLDVPVTHAFSLMRVRDRRDRQTADRKAKSAHGGARGFHERYRADRRRERRSG